MAPFASTAGVIREHFRWLKGEEKLSSFESSPGKLRYFWSMCGSHLVAERLNQPHVIVRAATLPEDFTEKLTEAVVGIEMVLTRLIGKWKVSQNQRRKISVALSKG